MTDTLSTGTLQGWDLFRPLGADALFARVLARKGTEPPVLLSRPSSPLRNEPGLETLLEGAIQVQKNLLHASLCRPLRLETLEGLPWLVQEGLEGLLLAEICQDPWPLHAAAEVGRQLCDALASLYAMPAPNGQSAMLIFPELTAANICISRFGDVKLLSPGFSMQGVPVPLLRLVLQQSGERMAPEARRPGAQLGPSVFQYTVGALLLELLSGERFAHILGASSYSPPDELEDCQKRLPGRLSGLKLLRTHPLRPLLEKLLAWNSEQRFPTLEEAGRALLSFAWTHPDAGGLEPTLAPGMATTPDDFPTWLEQAFRQHGGQDTTPVGTADSLGPPPSAGLSGGTAGAELGGTTEATVEDGFRFGALLDDSSPVLPEATAVGALSFQTQAGQSDLEGLTQTQREAQTLKATPLSGVPSADDALRLPQTGAGVVSRGASSEESTFVNDPLAAPPPQSKPQRSNDPGPERTPHAGLWVSGSRGPISAHEENTPVKPLTPVSLNAPAGSGTPAGFEGGAQAPQAQRVRASGIFETRPPEAGASATPSSPGISLEGRLGTGTGPGGAGAADGVGGGLPPKAEVSSRRRALILGAIALLGVVVLLGIFTGRGKPSSSPSTQGDSAGLTVGDPYQDQQLEPERASNPALNGRTDEPQTDPQAGGATGSREGRSAEGGSAAAPAVGATSDTASDEARIKALLSDDDEGQRLPPEILKPFRGRVRKGHGNLEIQTSPSDALVIVNGDQSLNPPFALEEVPAGQVQLIFRSMELGQRDVVIIDLRPGETFRGTWSFREKRWVMEE